MLPGTLSAAANGSRMLKRALLIVGLNVVVIAFLFELAGNILFWADGRGAIYYLRDRTLTAYELRNNPWGVADYRPILHPYFGFLYAERSNASQTVSLNNHLFLQDRAYAQKSDCCDFPLRKRAPDEFIVAFFGGSVAGGIALTAQEEDRLGKLLRASPRFANKRITTLNFAVGGHKQPQQLMILAYYLSLGQVFDAVINIDGFNEVVFGPANAERGVAVGYPNPYQWLRLATFLSEQAIRPNPEDVISVYRDMMARHWSRWMARCRFAACYLFGRSIVFWYGTGRVPTVSAATPTQDYVTLNRPMIGADPVLQTTEQWAASLRLMHALASSHGSKFLAVVQPNQWFRASPKFTPRASPDEFTERVARSVPPGYHALLAHLPDLRTQGVTVLDHTRLFDSEPDNIYSDDCCHFSVRGNAMLLEAVAQWLIRYEKAAYAAPVHTTPR